MKNLSAKNLFSNAFFGVPVFVLLFAFAFMSFTSEATFPDDVERYPIAHFSVSNGGCIAPCAITFTNSSQNATSYLWDFGDGTTSTAISPSHTYTSAGSYAVKLIAFGDGCEAPSFIIIEEVAQM